METPGCKDDQTLSGKPDLPLKKRILDRGKVVCNVPRETENLQIDKKSSKLPKITLGVAEQASKIDSQDQSKACIDQEKQKANPKTEATIKNDEAELSFKTYLQLNGEGKGESSEPPSLPLPSAAPPSQRAIVCKFCGQHFSTTQALGGHQNAHKKEREIQRAMKAAQEFGTNPFLYSLPGILSHPLSGSYDGQRLRYHPYNGYAQRAFEARPVYSNHSVGPSWAPTSFGRTLEEVIRPSPIDSVGTLSDSGWRTPYACSVGPLRRSNGPTNFNQVASSNLTAYLKAMENEARLTKNQHMESSGLNLSLKSAESAMMGLLPKPDEFSKIESPMKQNEPTKLDLNLKL